MRFLILFVLLTGFFIGPEEIKHPERHFFVRPSFEADTLFRHSVRIDFRDTIPGDTLRVYTSEDGLIHSCSREINTGVCIDGECRRLRMELYWTVTGRYYGLILPGGEFLSKTEHVPFKEEDYKKLERVLENPHSVLGDYAIDELITEGEGNVDGITAATLAAVKEESVPDAVYTSHTLWHLVYGETQREIQNYARQHLTDELALQLIKSADFEDQLWTLENMGPALKWTSGLREAVLDKIMREHGILASMALSAFPDSILQESSMQLILTEGFSGMAYINQRNLLKRLKDGPHLDIQAARILAGKLSSLSAGIIGHVLEVFEAHQLRDERIDGLVVQLLDHDNRFIAGKAVDYLKTKGITDKKVLRKIKKTGLS